MTQFPTPEALASWAGGRDSLSWPRRDGLKWLHLDEGSASL